MLVWLLLGRGLVWYEYFEFYIWSMASGCGVTANILVLGTSDSGFESLHPDGGLHNKHHLIGLSDQDLLYEISPYFSWIAK